MRWHTTVHLPGFVVHHRALAQHCRKAAARQQEHNQEQPRDQNCMSSLIIQHSSHMSYNNHAARKFPIRPKDKSFDMLKLRIGFPEFPLIGSQSFRSKTEATPTGSTEKNGSPYATLRRLPKWLSLARIDSRNNFEERRVSRSLLFGL